MRRSKAVAIAPWLPLALLLLFAAQSASALVTVGPGAQCEFKNVQAAIDKVIGRERTNFNVDPYIGVSGGYVYNEALVIDSTNVGSYTVFGTPFTGAFVQIYGDYDADCQTENENGPVAKIGAGGTNPAIKTHSVLEILGSSPVSVVLNHLVLAEATTELSDIVDLGGGIFFHDSSGSLELSNVEITDNDASRGGGVHANGQAPGISIVLHSGTWIHGNRGVVGGGGIFIEGQTRLLALEAQTLIEYNHSGSMGGGILIDGPAIADIGSPGYDGAPVISNNGAGSGGGGIAAKDGGVVRLFASYASLPARIEYNTASSGGGIFADYQSKVCGDGYSISHNEGSDGTAIFADHSSFVDLTESAFIQCNADRASLPPRAACPACNSISGNATFVSGSTIVLTPELATGASPLSRFSAENVLIDGNSGYQLVKSAGPVSLANCVVADNAMTQNLINVSDSNSVLTIDSCTLTQNNVSGGNVSFVPSGDFYLRHSIVWEASTMLSRFDNVHLTDLITNDANTLNSSSDFAEFTNVHGYDPAFAAPGSGDFRLTAESPAVDYATTGLATDITGQGRGVRLLRTAAPYDIGAYELQNLGDVIFLNGFEP